MEIGRDWGLRTPSPKSTVRDLPCLRVHAVGLAFRRKPEVIASVLRFCGLRISQNARKWSSQNAPNGLRPCGEFW